MALIKAYQRFVEKDGGKEFRLTLVLLSAVIAGIVIFAPYMTNECAILGFFVNLIWIYGK